MQPSAPYRPTYTDSTLQTLNFANTAYTVPWTIWTPQQLFINSINVEIIEQEHFHEYITQWQLTSSCAPSETEKRSVLNNGGEIRKCQHSRLGFSRLTSQPTKPTMTKTLWQKFLWMANTIIALLVLLSNYGRWIVGRMQCRRLRHILWYSRPQTPQADCARSGQSL